jgi:hypothetical protein
VGVGFDLDVHENMSPVVFEIEVHRGGVLVGHTFTNARAFGTSPVPDCFGSMQVDGLVEGERLTARVRVFDSAANASDFVTFSFTPNRALAGSRQPCGGCNAGSTGSMSPIPAWATALMLLGAAGCRHRRRRGVVTR